MQSSAPEGGDAVVLDGSPPLERLLSRASAPLDGAQTELSPGDVCAEGTRPSQEEVESPNEALTETCTVRFLCTTGKAFVATFPVYATIGQVKQALLDIHPVELEDQQKAMREPPVRRLAEIRLLYLGAILNDEETLLECGFEVDGMRTVHILVRRTPEERKAAAAAHIRELSNGHGVDAYLSLGERQRLRRVRTEQVSVRGADDSERPCSGRRRLTCRGDRTAPRAEAQPTSILGNVSVTGGVEAAESQVGLSNGGAADNPPVAATSSRCGLCSVM